MFADGRTMGQYEDMWRSMNKSEKDYARKKVTGQLLAWANISALMIPFRVDDRQVASTQIYTMVCLIENAARFQETENSYAFASMCASLREVASLPPIRH